MKMPARPTTGSVGEQAVQLLALLEAENAALADMRVDVVAASLARKRHLVALVFGSSEGHADRPELSPEIVGRLRDVVRRNTVLLDAAIHGQQEVMRVIASAVQSSGQRSGYAGGGYGLAPSAVLGAAILTSA